MYYDVSSTVYTVHVAPAFIEMLVKKHSFRQIKMHKEEFVPGLLANHLEQGDGMEVEQLLLACQFPSKWHHGTKMKACTSRLAIMIT